MRMKELNNDSINWFQHARGFHEAYRLVFIEYDTLFRRGLLNGDVMLLMVPQRYLFIHTVELYMKAFLVAKGLNSKELESSKYGHDLSKLRKKCAEFDIFFNKDTISYLDHCAGSTKNFPGAKYPEGGASASFYDLVRLEDIYNHIRFCDEFLCLEENKGNKVTKIVFE